MSISSISTATTTPALAKPAQTRQSHAVEAATSTNTKAADQPSGAIALKAAPASSAKAASSTQNLARLKTLAGQHMSASQIASQLGISVSTVMQEAAGAGINLNAGSTSGSADSADIATKTVNAETGKGTGVDVTA